MGKTVLVVDDDQRLCQLLGQWIREAGWHVLTAYGAEEALAQADQADIAVVDYMMPQINGLELVRKLPDTLPILMLTAVDELPKKLLAFESGVDDYLTKPFEPAELLARLQALLRRRTAPVKERAALLTWPGHTFDRVRGQLKCGDNLIDLSSTEVLFLKMLAQNPFSAVSRGDLAKRAGHFVSERAVDVQINRLRKKINDLDGRVLQTVRHVGYALFAEKET